MAMVVMVLAGVVVLGAELVAVVAVAVERHSSRRDGKGVDGGERDMMLSG